MNKGISSAHFYDANLVPYPDQLVINKAYLAACPELVLRRGLQGLHSVLSRVYRTAAQAPQDFTFHKKPHQSRALHDLTDQIFISLPTLLYLLGLHGQGVEVEDRLVLQVDPDLLAGACQAAKIKAYEISLGLLGPFGVAVLASPPTTLLFPQVPEIAAALPVFAKACRPFVKKENLLPLEFGRIDLRVLAYPPDKKKSIPAGVEEAIRLLDEEQAAFLTGLDAWAKEAGYRPDVKYGTLHNAAWRANYRHPRLGKALFGFAIDSGRLSMHLNFNQAGRAIPYILEMPEAFQDLYFEKCNCAGCGQCEAGPVEVVYGGEIHRMCGYSYFSLPEIPKEFQAPICKLLQIQDGFLKQGDKEL